MTVAALALRGPRWQRVLREQVSTTFLVLRPFFLAVTTVLLLGDALLLSDVMLDSRVPHPTRGGWSNVSFTPEESLIAVCVAIILAILLWLDEDRARRAYHWCMPVNRRQHAFLKFAAGWVAAIALTLVFIANILLLSASVAHIQSRSPLLLGGLPWWTLLVPLTSVSIAYALTSAACIGTQRPIVWVGGLPIVFTGSVMLCGAVTFLRRFRTPMVTVWSGSYGLSNILGNILHDARDSGSAEHANASRWLLSTGVWGACALALLLFAASRPPEKS